MSKDAYKGFVGKRFGNLIVIKEDAPNERRQRFFECKCDCGSITKKWAYNLKIGTARSCGCKTGEIITRLKTTHGLSRTIEYRIWVGIVGRCRWHPDYAGRGIKLSRRWKKFENFYRDMGKRPSSSHSIDRINNNKGYYPKNCRWATQTVQNGNKRNTVIYMGENAKDASIRLSGNISLVSNRIRKGWSADKAFSTPPQHHLSGFKKCSSASVDSRL